MWSKLRNILIFSVSVALLLFGMGFAVNTQATMPDYALVFVDEANSAYLAPQCVNEWRRRPAEKPGNLRRSNAGEARGHDYAPDEKCAKTSAFTPPGASISRLALQKIGVMPPQKQWWDVPYRTEDGMVYPPRTHV